VQALFAGVLQEKTGKKNSKKKREFSSAYCIYALGPA
jgi:hypothetical protein